MHLHRCSAGRSRLEVAWHSHVFRLGQRPRRVMPCEPCECGPRWTITGEGIALQRSTTRSQPLLVGIQTQQPNSTNSLDSQNVNFPLASGPKVSAIRHDVLRCGWDVEVGYFQVDGFSARSTLPGLAYLVTDVTGPGNRLFSVQDGEVFYNSALYSGEVNLRRQWCDWL